MNSRDAERLSLTEAVYRVADELRSQACQGLRFTALEYDREQYERILQASARLVAAVEQRSPQEVVVQFRDNLSHISPFLGADAAVFRAERLLLIQRQDNHRWAMPGGLVEVGETLAEACERELQEEALIRGKAVRLLGIFDSRRWKSHTKAQLYHVIFQVENDGGQPAAGSEALDAGFFAEDGLPPLSPGHERIIPVIFKLYRGELPSPYFDETGAK
jgi:ADP-ribose pyrophosphatase YjhB (NUDIX family)